MNIYTPISFFKFPLVSMGNPSHTIPLFAKYGCEAGTLEGTICNGWLIKKPTNKKCGLKKRRYFILLPSAILYYTREYGDSNSWKEMKPRGVFEISHKSEIDFNTVDMSISISGSKDGIQDNNILKLYALPEDDAQEVLEQWQDFLKAAIEELSRKWRNGPIQIDKRKSFLPTQEQSERLFGTSILVQESQLTSTTLNSIGIGMGTMGTIQSEKYGALYGGNTYTQGNTFTNNSMSVQNTHVSAPSYRGSLNLDDNEIANNLYG